MVFLVKTQILLNRILLLSGVTALGATASAEHARAAGRSVRPNIIIILADDLGYGDISCFGGTNAVTANLDRMAEGGMRFTDFHTNGVVSTPSRAALVTGRYQQRAGLEWVYDNRDQVGLEQGEVTVADVMRRGGYKTAMFGKWHIGMFPQHNPMNHGFEQFTGCLSGNIDYVNRIEQHGTYDWWKGTSNTAHKGYATDEINALAVDFIKQNRKKPFFLYVSHICPHFPYQGPDDPEFRVLGVRDQAQFKATDKVRPERYKEMIEEMDKGIGDILRTLRETGLEENTLVVFTSDNGPTGPGSAGGFRGQKGTPYEGGHRVPAIAYWKGRIAPGKSSDGTFALFDLYPTALAVAGLDNKGGKPLDGISMLGEMVSPGAQKAVERTLFWRFRQWSVVRRGDMKLILDSGAKPQLYDLRRDPGEKTNLAAQNPSLVAQLTSAIEAWGKDVDQDAPERETNQYK